MPKLPKLPVRVITQIIFYVSVVVNTPVHASSLIEMIILILKYNYCYYPWITFFFFKQMIIFWLTSQNVGIFCLYWLEKLALVVER